MRFLASLLKHWDWGLFGLIFLYMALPQFYRSYSIFLIGNAIPDASALATVAQWQFVELALEVIQETFVLAIFFFVGKSIQENLNPGYAIRTIYTVIFSFSLLFTAFLFIFSGSFVDIIGTPESLQNTTSQFLRIKVISIPIVLLSAASVIIVETINRKKLILAMAVLGVLYRAILDSLFYGGYAFSLDLGVLGVAWSDTLAAFALFLTLLFFMKPMIRETIPSWLAVFSLRDWRTYVRVGSWSGLDSLVRNIAYSFMIIRMINLIGENAIGGYFLAMHIFWSFLLVPILALSETAKVLVANHFSDLPRLRTLWFASVIIAGMIIVLWIILIPLWRPFAQFLNPNVTYVDNSVLTVMILFVPYILMALNLVTDSIFYGTGKTRYMAYQSMITNGTVYGVAFIFYLTGLWSPTFTSILWIFGLGILVDSALTLFFALRVLYPGESHPLGINITDAMTSDNRA